MVATAVALPWTTRDGYMLILGVTSPWKMTARDPDDPTMAIKRVKYLGAVIANVRRPLSLVDDDKYSVGLFVARARPGRVTTNFEAENLVEFLGIDA